MLKAIFAASLIALGFSGAVAGELDQENTVTNQNLQGSVVIRVDQRTGEVSMAKLTQNPTDKEAAQALISNLEFNQVAADHLRSELDQDGGASSWYWYYNPYSYASLGWYGYNYYPYYNYSYSYYNYYCFSSYAWGRYWYW